jgi:YaiO family outer membrane protein
MSRHRHALASAALALGALTLAARADAPPGEAGIALRLDRSSLELRLAAQQVSGGYGDWREAGVSGLYSHGDHVLRGELATLRRFNRSGSYVAVADTVTLDPDWYASVAAGAGDGAFYLPRYRFDAFAHRKLLAARSLVLSLGVGHYRSPDGHVDRSITAGALFYFAAPWIVQAGVRWNESDPGSVLARQQVVAVTYGRDPSAQLVARYTWGRESYLAIGPAASLVDFRSEEANIQWRYRLDRSQGISVAAEHYRNPAYHRTGLLLGYFVELK